MSIWNHAAFLPDHPAHCRFTLGEGNTPLVRSRRIGRSVGLENLYFKLESVNPTGSYKDRFAAAAVSSMLAEGASTCLATSSGNAGAALAAYCAAAGLGCQVAVVESAPQDKLTQMLAYGASVFRIRGFGTDSRISGEVLASLQQFASSGRASLQISAYRYSPEGMQGVETLAPELVEQLQGKLDHLFSPSGGGGLTLAVARGFQKCRDMGLLQDIPRVECVQPAGNDTIAGPLATGATAARRVECTTQVSGLQVPVVIDGQQTLSACRATAGTGHLVSDEDVYAAQARLSAEEGIFCEPAAAVALAGALAAARNGYLASSANVVCLVTGTGFKDNSAVARMISGREARLLETPTQVTEFLEAAP